VDLSVALSWALTAPFLSLILVASTMILVSLAEFLAFCGLLAALQLHCLYNPDR